MLQGSIFKCNTCGGDELTHPHGHNSQLPVIQLYRCPICGKYKLLTEDPNDDRVDWVALGEVVCGRECHEKAYDLMRHMQHELPLRLGDP